MLKRVEGVDPRLTCWGWQEEAQPRVGVNGWGRDTVVLGARQKCRNWGEEFTK